MSVLNENQLLGASAAGGDYEIEQSLRFNDDDGSYLSRTPSVAGNRKTWTYSIWVKRSNLGIYGKLFHEYSGQTARSELAFDTSDFLRFNFGGDVETALKPTQVFRDTSAWYHIIWSVDTTQSTASDRVNAYINGVKITDFSEENYPALNAESGINLASQHEISGKDGASQFIDGYLAEINFIDGQALTPDSFGETGDYGEWKPTKYAGTYGTNGFYLPFKQDYTVEGFSTVTYEGNGATQYIGGTGFQPDFLWIKRRDATASHCLFDAIRGVSDGLHSDTAAVEFTDTGVQKEFNTDGFTVGNHQYSNYNGGTYVAWNWDMGGTTASNTSGSITSSVRANTTYGQSIVSYTGNGTGGSTIGHGLASAPTLIIVKKRSQADDWKIYSETLGNTKALAFTTATPVTTSAYWNNTSPTSSVFSVGHGGHTNASGQTNIAYCFHDVTGYSKFGSYSGTGSSNAITTGFAPAFVMVKRTNSTGNWVMWDNARVPSGVIVGDYLQANLSDAENDPTGSNAVTFTTTGFTLTGNGIYSNSSSDTFIYMCFADTREYAYWLDQSGNNNDWTSEGGLTESDVMVDSPTNNFATLNPLTRMGGTGNYTSVFSEGNLRMTQTVAGWGIFASTHSMPTGKYYWEMYMATTTGGTEDINIGLCVSDLNRAAADGLNTTDAYGWYASTTGVGHKYDSTGTSGLVDMGATYSYTWGDVCQLAYDADSGKMFVGLNGTWLGSGNPATGANPFITVSATNKGNLIPAFSQYPAHARTIANFGQDSSFAGLKTPQGNQDANGIGDFYYAPPAGFLALCTQNLPDATVIPSEHFSTVLYGGSATTPLVVTGAGFAPDMVWLKARDVAWSHGVFSRLNGIGAGSGYKYLHTNTTGVEADTWGAITLDSDGWSGVSSGYDGTFAHDFGRVAKNFVSWNWKAGGAGVSNTDGTITSSVSANAAAGFSIVSYTGNGTAGATVGHGLSKIPDMIITKARSNTGYWVTWHKDLTGAFASNGAYSYLNTTGVPNTTTVFYDGTGITSSVFKWRGGNENVNQSSRTYLSYCFHSVDGHSKVGSYTGNGLVDGTFVHCGFRPKFVLIKDTTNVNEWRIYDVERADNTMYDILVPNSSNAEGVSGHGIDVLSNGFKVRGTAVINASSANHIFLAFAEMPFKHTNAR
jgi:hypothetical protein